MQSASYFRGLWYNSAPISTLKPDSIISNLLSIPFNSFNYPRRTQGLKSGIRRSGRTMDMRWLQFNTLWINIQPTTTRTCPKLILSVCNRKGLGKGLRVRVFNQAWSEQRHRLNNVMGSLLATNKYDVVACVQFSSVHRFWNFVQPRFVDLSILLAKNWKQEKERSIPTCSKSTLSPQQAGRCRLHIRLNVEQTDGPDLSIKRTQGGTNFKPLCRFCCSATWTDLDSVIILFWTVRASPHRSNRTGG